MWNPPAIPARQASLVAVPSSSPVTYVTVPRLRDADREQLARVRREAAGPAVAIAARLGSRAPTTPGTSTATRQSADVSLHPPPLPASLTCGTREYRFARRTRSSSAARRPSATPTSRSALARSACRALRARSAPGASIASGRRARSRGPARDVAQRDTPASRVAPGEGVILRPHPSKFFGIFGGRLIAVASPIFFV